MLNNGIKIHDNNKNNCEDFPPYGPALNAITLHFTAEQFQI
jgi:hypothetical protein